MSKKGWLSLLLNIIIAICGAVASFNFTDFGLSTQIVGIIVVCVGAVNAVCAFLLGKKGAS